MCLSSVYKEKALGDDDIDVIFLNGWVAIFQFLSGLLFAVPSAYAMGLPVSVNIILPLTEHPTDLRVDPIRRSTLN